MNKRITALWKFLTYDIWRITEDEVTKTTFSLYNIIKTIYLCINRFTKDRLVNKASALTYSTLLAIVPILAILFAMHADSASTILWKAKYEWDLEDTIKRRK